MQLKQATRQTLLCLLAVTALISTTAQADRIIKIVEESYELAIDGFSLPGNGFGPVFINHCEDCEPVTVSSTTRYFFRDRLISLNEFQSQLAAALQAPDMADRAMVNLRYSPETRVATRVEIDIF